MLEYRKRVLYFSIERKESEASSLKSTGKNTHVAMWRKAAHFFCLRRRRDGESDVGLIFETFMDEGFLFLIISQVCLWGLVSQIFEQL